MNAKQQNKILKAAKDLDNAEKQLEISKELFQKASELATKLTGLELWHTDARGGLYFWRNPRNFDDSTKYNSRTEAIKALIDQTIEWE